MKTRLLLAAMLICSAAGFALAQDERSGKNELMFWGGISPDSTTTFKVFGRTPDARAGVTALRYSRRFNVSRHFDLKYTADVLPAVFLYYPDSETNASITESVRPARYGFGAAPLGVQLNLRPRKRLQPFIATSGGMLYFNKRTPNGIGTRFNFTADVGGGVEFRLNHQKAVTIGYKYFHISNGDRGILNPGFDNNLFYVGYTFFSK